MTESRMFRAGTASLGNLAQGMVRFGEQQYERNGTSLERFGVCMVGCDNTAANAGIYQLFVEFVRTLAAKNNVEGADGEAVEACRKICALMGWMPREV